MLDWVLFLLLIKLLVFLVNIESIKGILDIIFILKILDVVLKLVVNFFFECLFWDLLVSFKFCCMLVIIILFSRIGGMWVIFMLLMCGF